MAKVHSSEATISWLAQLCKCAAANSTMHCSAMLCCSILQNSIALFCISMQCTVVLLITMQGVGTQCTVQSWRSRAEHIGRGVLLQQQQEFSSTVVGWSAQLLSVQCTSYIVYIVTTVYWLQEEFSWSVVGWSLVGTTLEWLHCHGTSLTSWLQGDRQAASELSNKKKEFKSMSPESSSSQVLQYPISKKILP